MGRRRSNSKPIIAAILRQIDATMAALKLPSEETGAIPDLDLMWEWQSAANPSIKREVTRDEFEGTGAASSSGWPLPGVYRVTIVDSNGDPDPRFDPWEAEHVDKDMLAGPRPEGSDGMMGAIHGLLEEHRVDANTYRRERDQAKTREQQAETDRRTAQAQLIEAQNQVAAFKLAAERAIADAAYAKEKQREAEDAYRELDRQVHAFEPQFKAGVDRVIERVLGPFMPVTPAENDEGPPSQERKIYPPGEDSPERVKAEVDDILRAVIMDIDVCRPMVEAGKLDWETVRYVAFKLTGHDVGPAVDWSPWEPEAAEETSDAG